MKKLQWSIALALGASVTQCGKMAPIVTIGDESDPRFADILSTIESDMGRYGVPGGAIAIVQNGELVFAAGLGVKTRDGADPVTPATLFRVDSLSKMVTAATAMKLVEEGKLDLSKPVTDYVPLTLAPGFDPSIPVEKFLTHTSGIPDISVNTTICPAGPGQAAAWFAAHGSQPLWSPPGAVWDYSNQGFGVVGWVIESVSGTSFEDAVASRVFAPAHMATATYDVVAATAGDHADGHSTNHEYAPDAYDCAVVRPPGGIVASVVDYAHFTQTFMSGGGEMLTPTSVATMSSAHVDTDSLPNGQAQYGYGLDVIDGYKGLHLIEHSGSDEGYRSELLMVPDQQLSIIVFYGSSVRKPLTVARHALDVMASLTNVAAPDYETDASTWGKYAGTYFDPNVMGSIEVDFDGAHLTWTAAQIGVDHATLTQSSGDEFTSGSHTITFYPDASGPAAWFVTRDGVGARVH